MKPLIVFSILLAGLPALSQNNGPGSLLPREIKFDKNVVQKLNDKKNGTLSYYFTESGEFAAMKAGEKDQSLIIYNKEGKMFIVNEKDKSIIVMEKAIKKGEEMAKDNKNVSKDSSGVKGSFKKTGNTKTICSYPGEEYEITTEKSRMKAWYIKTDFVSFPMMAMGMNPAAGGKNVPAGEMDGIPGLGQNYFMAEMEKDNKKVIETISISKTDFTFSSTGYTVRDMSDLMKGKYN